jgi:hypothetical protein
MFTTFKKINPLGNIMFFFLNGKYIINKPGHRTRRTETGKSRITERGAIYRRTPKTKNIHRLGEIHS